MSLEVNAKILNDTNFFKKDTQKVKLQRFKSHFHENTLRWGELPYYKNDPSYFVKLLQQDFNWLYEKYNVDVSRFTRDQYVALLVHRFKFNISLTELIEDIISNYPLSRVEENCKTYSISGLPGAGKTSLARIIANNWPSEFVVMESSDARYYLFAKKMLSLEANLQAKPENCKAMLEAPAYTVMTGFALSICSEILNNLGYNVIHVNNEFIINIEKLYADKILFLNHRNLSVQAIAENDFFKNNEQDEIIRFFRHGKSSLPPEMHSLWRSLISTHSQPLHEHDSYDWHNPATVTDFKEMRPIRRSRRPAVIGLQLQKIHRQILGIGKHNTAKNWVVLNSAAFDTKASSYDFLWREFLEKTGVVVPIEPSLHL